MVDVVDIATNIVASKPVATVIKWSPAIIGGAAGCLVGVKVAESVSADLKWIGIVGGILGGAIVGNAVYNSLS